MFSRRQALKFLLSMPPVVIGFTDSKGKFLFPRETLMQCAAGIEACWSIFYEGAQPEAERFLPTYRRTVAQLAEQGSELQKGAAALASQAYQLACLIDSQKGDFDSALYWGKQAFEYATLADDPDLKVASLMRQSIIHWYFKQPRRLVETELQALLYIKDASPLLQAIVYGQMAEGYAWLGQEQEALKYKGLALDTHLPEGYENDPSFTYTHFSYFSLHGDIGLMHLRLGNYKDAWNELESIERKQPAIEIPQRAELLVRQAEFSFAWGDLDLSSSRVEAALKLVIDLSHQQVSSDELRAVYQQMQVKWPYEQRIKALGKYFRY